MVHLNLPFSIQQPLYLRDMLGNAQGDFSLLPQRRDLFGNLLGLRFQRRFRLRLFDPAQPKPQNIALLFQL